ncbi:hypothetical protein [uncultured Thiodictyon sp.]|uniref:hypothetical protein n=1 Tax=uncultured Thiodictyon sp. TaxID=1846217 RepID=UPI0025EDB1E6|nr:hypothetical protein [uncultured Thiodictyon sp.]
MYFSLKSPTLFEPEAIPSVNEFLHDEPEEKSERLAKIRKFAQWLVAQMERNGFSTNGLGLDGDGWVFEVPSDAGFVMCIVSNLDGDEDNIGLLVTEIGGAPETVARGVEAMLSKSPEIVELNVAR